MGDDTRIGRAVDAGEDGTDGGSGGQVSAAAPDPPEPPPEAVTFFGEGLPRARVYVGMLADSGVSHGLIGPREVPRLWGRHVLNCAVVEKLIPAGASVIDVGSGAGLPGLCIAIARPDVHVVLVEPLLRRTTWLATAVDTLGLDNVVVRRGKAEAFHGELAAPVVTARAVSRLSNLAAWCAPLLQTGGHLLALKGVSAAEELTADAPMLRRHGLVGGEVLTVGEGVVTPPTTVVRLQKVTVVEAPRGRRGRATGKSSH